MASNQKASQHKRPKTTHNCFLACFGFHPKTNTATAAATTTTSSYKKKPKKFGVRKKFFFKLFWPKFKVMTIDNNNSNNKKKKNNNNNKMQKLEAAKTAAFKASHNIMLEAATKVHHQFKTIDHHAPKSITTQEPIAVLKESTHQDQQSHCSKSQSKSTMCNTEDNVPPKATMVKQSLLMADKTTKDSLIGASVMVAMLIIMSIWGRLCAIVCMCGWLYCIPLIRGDREVASSKSNDTDTKMGVDFNSELYKKKVVLNGLLQRDHQDAVGIS